MHTYVYTSLGQVSMGTTHCLIELVRLCTCSDGEMEGRMTINGDKDYYGEYDDTSRVYNGSIMASVH